MHSDILRETIQLTCKMKNGAKHNDEWARCYCLISLKYNTPKSGSIAKPSILICIFFHLDGKETLSVVSIDDALKKVPVPAAEIVSERKEDFEVEELFDESSEAFQEDEPDSKMDSSDDGKISWK